MTYKWFIALLLSFCFITPTAHASTNTISAETYQTINGQQLQLNQLQGKKVLLHFWATWCPPCKEELREIEIFNKTNKNNFAVISVAVQSEKEKVYRLNKALGLTYPTVLDEQETISKKFHVTMLPTTVLIQDGKVLKKHVGAMNLDQLQQFVK